MSTEPLGDIVIPIAFYRTTDGKPKTRALKLGKLMVTGSQDGQRYWAAINPIYLQPAVVNESRKASSEYATATGGDPKAAYASGDMALGVLKPNGKPATAAATVLTSQDGVDSSAESIPWEYEGPF